MLHQCRHISPVTAGIFPGGGFLIKGTHLSKKQFLKLSIPSCWAAAVEMLEKAWSARNVKAIFPICCGKQLLEIADVTEETIMGKTPSLPG